MSKIALDTNILIYLHDAEEGSFKRKKAKELLSLDPIISSQVVSEYLNVCNRKLKLSKLESIGSLMG